METRLSGGANEGMLQGATRISTDPSAQPLSDHRLRSICTFPDNSWEDERTGAGTGRRGDEKTGRIARGFLNVAVLGASSVIVEEEEKGGKRRQGVKCLLKRPFLKRMGVYSRSARPLSGRVAIVTGSTRGIGREIALKLASEGADIVVVGKTTEPHPTLPGTIYTVAEEVSALGARSLPLKVDVRDDQQVEDMVAKTIKAFGRVDYLINNSGALWWQDVMDTPMKKYDLVHGVNSRAAFSASRAVLPHMLAQNFGHIITMSPPVDLNLLKGKVAYCISKFGMTMLAQGLGQEVHGRGVAVNALWPATLIESLATKNFQMADRSQWRKATILSDAVFGIVQEDPNTFTAQALIDEEYFAFKGITDLSKYRCDPDVEPRKAWPPVAGWKEFSPPPGAKIPPGIRSKL